MSGNVYDGSRGVAKFGLKIVGGASELTTGCGLAVLSYNLAESTGCEEIGLYLPGDGSGLFITILISVSEFDPDDE